MASDGSSKTARFVAQNAVVSDSTQNHSEDLVIRYMKSPRSGLDGSLHPGLDTNNPRITSDKKSRTWKEVELEDSLEKKALPDDLALEQEAFKKAMEKYQKTQKQEDMIKIDVSPSLTVQEYITEMMRSISQAQQLYEDDAVKGFWGSIRKSFRKLGENECAFVAWLGLLPVDSNYISVLCGGLKLIIGAAARLRKLNKEVVGAICQIPQSMSKCQRLLSINDNSSQQLRDCSTALYVSILRAMGHILEYYTKDQWGKTAAVFTKQARFETKLTTKIEAIKECSRAIDEEALVCSQELGKSTNQIIRTVEKVVKLGQEKLDSLHTTSQVIMGGNTEIRQGQQQTDARIESLASALTGIQKLLVDYTEVRRNRAMSTGASNDIIDSIVADCEAFFANQDGTRILLTQSITASELPILDSTSSRQSKTGESSLQTTKKKLLSRLQKEYTSKDFSQTDIRSNLSHIFDLSLEEQDRAIYAIQALSRHSFLHASASSVLLINGQAADVTTRRTPLTFLCAKLCDALRSAPKWILCLSFFCGEHANQRDEPLVGSAAIMNSLIGQLVTQYKRFDFKLLEKHISALEKNDIGSMKKVFSKLLSQLPDDFMVFCVLDELTEYIDEERTSETQEMLGVLTSMVKRREKKERGCMFKLLLTAAVQLNLPMVGDLNDDEVINVPEGLDMQGGFTAVQWDLTVGKDVEDLRLMA